MRELSNKMAQQSHYFVISLSSKDYYNEDKKIVVKSIKELKEFVKRELKYLTYEFPELENKIKKRMYQKNMYCDTTDGKTLKTGKVYSFGKKGRLTDEEIEDCFDESYISYWCHKVPLKELKHYSGFKGIDE
jgi:hypothetical protein